MVRSKKLVRLYVCQYWGWQASTLKSVNILSLTLPPPTKKMKPLTTNFKKYLISNLIKMGGKLNINNFKKRLTPNPK